MDGSGSVHLEKMQEVVTGLFKIQHRLTPEVVSDIIRTA